MTLRCEEVDGISLACISGELDGATAHELRRQLDPAPPPRVIDLSEVTFLDSGGLHLLFWLASHSRPRRRIGFVVPPDSAVRDVVDLVQLANVSPVCDTRAEALTAVRRP